MSSTVRPRAKKYDAVEMKPLAPSLDDDPWDDEPKTKTDQWLNWIWYKLHALLWIIISSALAVHTQLYEVITEGSPPARPEAKLNRCVQPRASSRVILVN